jgi:REP element-mobilizing transposase RayT
MACKLGIAHAGTVYHVMSRGDRREPIFKDDPDRLGFLNPLGHCCERTAWRVHTLCLMANHFHLVVETPQPNSMVGMKWFLHKDRIPRDRRAGRQQLQR